MTEKAWDVAEAIETRVSNWLGDKYGQEVLDYCKRKLSMGETIKTYLAQNEDTLDLGTDEDIKYTAGVLYDVFRALAELRVRRSPSGASDTGYHRDYATIADLASYSLLIGRVVSDRERLLGNRTPLSAAQAAAWLRSRAEDMYRFRPENTTLTVTIRSSGNRARSRNKDPVEAGTLSAKPDLSVPAIMLLGDSPVEYVSSLEKFAAGVDSLEGIDLSSRSLLPLAECAESYVQSMGAASYNAAMDRAVWLLLTGRWHMQTSLFIGTSTDAEVQPHPVVPFTTLTIAHNILTGKQLVGELMDIGALAPRPGRRRSAECFVLGVLAIEERELLGFGRSGRGFLRQLMRAWQARAQLYSCDPTRKYQDGQAVRSALRSLDEAYEKYRKSLAAQAESSLREHLF